jgi:peroxiredoxin
MLLLNRSWFMLAAVSLALTCTGCSPKASEKPPERIPSGGRPAAKVEKEQEPTLQVPSKSAQEPQRTAVAHKPKPADIPPPPTIPKVELSNELRATCLVNVGDEMPAGELPDAAGDMHALGSLYGQKLTVICFWTVGTSPRSKLVAVAVLHDLMKGIVEPYGEKGVRVVGINVGDAAQAVEQHVAGATATFPNLHDAKGEFFAKVVKDGKMPRTFLLDANGKVLWFDVEYSREARRNLIVSIKAVL